MEQANIHAEIFDLMKNAYQKCTAAGYGDFFQGELKILNYLYGTKPDSVTPSELCKQLYMTSARVAAALNSAEKKEYITRNRSDIDKRSVFVNITQIGKEYAAAKLSLLDSDIDFLLDGLGEKDSAELVRLMSKAIEIFDKKNKDDGVDR